MKAWIIWMLWIVLQMTSNLEVKSAANSSGTMGVNEAGKINSGKSGNGGLENVTLARSNGVTSTDVSGDVSTKASDLESNYVTNDADVNNDVRSTVPSTFDESEPGGNDDVDFEYDDVTEEGDVIYDESDDVTYTDDDESDLEGGEDDLDEGHYDPDTLENEVYYKEEDALNMNDKFGNITRAKGDVRMRYPPRPPPTTHPLPENSTTWLQSNTSHRPMSPEERLLRDLFAFYTPDARAGIDSSETVTAHVQYTLMRIRKLDERTQVFTTAGLVITEWEDVRLRWEPEDYGNVSDLVVPPFYVWLPELTLMNAAEHMTQDFDKMGVLISHTGRIHWEPGGIFSTTCDMDITFFPFDIQKCSIVVGTWAYYSQRLNLTNATSEISLHDYTEHGEWEILATSVTWGETTLPCCPDVSYPYVMSTLKLKRRLRFYLMNIVTPCIILSVLVLIVFCIPLEAGEKISCGISVLLAFTVFLLMVSECIPRTSLQVPIIVVYLTCTMLLGTLSMAMSIIVLNVHFSHENEKVPKWIERFILNGLGKALCMGPYERDVSNGDSDSSDSDDPYGSSANQRDGILQNYNNINDQVQIKETAFRILGKKAKRLKCFSCKSGKRKQRQKRKRRSRQLPYEWREVTRVLDRLFFVIVAILMTSSTVLTLYAPVYASHLVDI